METAPVEYRSARRIRVGANSRMTELQRSHAELRRRTMARGLLPAVTQIGGRGEHLFRLCGDVPRVPFSTCETVAMVTPGFLAISFVLAASFPSSDGGLRRADHAGSTASIYCLLYN